MKETINKIKRQPTKQEKLFPNDLSDKELISKIYKEHIQLNIKKTKQCNYKMDKRPEQTFFPKKKYR